MGLPLIISQDAAVLNQVQSAAAAAGLDVAILDAAGDVRRAWSSASLVIVGVDKAAMVAGLGMPQRTGLHIVGTDADSVLAWSVPLDAPGLVLPQQAGFLAALLDDVQQPGGGAGVVLRLLGATGGVGTSTLAAGLAVRAAKRGKRAALVELNPFGGGIDLMMGAEQNVGWRWGDLAAARGHVGDLTAHLPTVLGVAIVATSRPPALATSRPPAVAPSATSLGSTVGPPEAVAAVLASLRRSHDLVVIDQGRQPPAGEDAILVVAADVRSVLAAQAQLATGWVTARQVIARTGPGRRLPTDLIAETLGVAVIDTMPQDTSLPGALEAGDPPGRTRGHTSKVLDSMLNHLIPGWAS